MRNSRRLLQFTTSVAMCALTRWGAHAAIYEVRQDGGGDFTNIQACVDALQTGDTCVVHAGVYDERIVTRTHGAAGNPITLRTQGTATVRGFEIGHDYVHVRGFDITGNTVMYDSFIEFADDVSYSEAVGNVIRDGIGVALSDLTFTDHGASNDTVTTVAGDFVAAGFLPGIQMRISSDHSISNAGTWDIKDVTPHTLVLSNNAELVNDGPVTAYLRTTVKGIGFDSSGPSATNAADHCRVASNTIHDLHYIGIDILGDAHEVDHNEIQGLHGYDALRAFGRNHAIRRNVVHDSPAAVGNANHPDIIQTFGNNGYESRDILFEQNLAYDFEGQMGMLEQTGVAGIRDWIFRSNVFVRVAWQLNVVIPGVQFINNTLFQTTRNTGQPIR